MAVHIALRLLRFLCFLQIKDFQFAKLHAKYVTSYNVLYRLALAWSALRQRQPTGLLWFQRNMTTCVGDWGQNLSCEKKIIKKKFQFKKGKIQTTTKKSSIQCTPRRGWERASCSVIGSFRSRRPWTILSTWETRVVATERLPHDLKIDPKSFELEKQIVKVKYLFSGFAHLI